MTSPDEPQLFAAKHGMTFMVSEELLGDYAGFDVADALRRAMNGEQVFTPIPPARHRCVFCWLVSLLPGHERCHHGWMNCDDCNSDY